MTQDRRSTANASPHRLRAVAGAVLAFSLTLAGCKTTGSTPEAVVEDTRPALDPAQVTRALDLADRALVEDRPQDARQILQQVNLSGHDGPRSRLLAGEAALALGELDRAVETLRPLVDAEAEDEAGAKAGAEVQAADRAFDRPRALRNLGLALLRRGERAEAAGLLARAGAGNPDDWRVWNALAFIADGDRAFDQAEAHYARALQTGGDLAQIHNNRGFSRLLQGRPDAAIADLSAALRHAPGMRVAETNMRLALAWRGDYARAVSGVAQDERGAALNNAGFVALMRGDYPAAERYLSRALDEHAGFNKQAYRNLTFLRSVKGESELAADPRGGPVSVQESEL